MSRSAPPDPLFQIHISHTKHLSPTHTFNSESHCPPEFVCFSLFDVPCWRLWSLAARTPCTVPKSPCYRLIHRYHNKASLLKCSGGDKEFFAGLELSCPLQELPEVFFFFCFSCFFLEFQPGLLWQGKLFLDMALLLIVHGFASNCICRFLLRIVWISFISDCGPLSLANRATSSIWDVIDEGYRHFSTDRGVCCFLPTSHTALYRENAVR